MVEKKKILLTNKLKQTALKLQVREYVKRKISYHWLDIFDSIKAAKIDYHIEYLCIVPEESHNYFIEAINDLKRPEFFTSLIKINEPNMMDNIFELYPSIDAFKYIMNLPQLSTSNTDFNTIIQQTNNLPKFEEEAVYFLSPDWSPLIRMNWKDIIEKGEDVFNHIPLPFLFTNPAHTKILFKSLEDEWRATML
jgi:hypothetical protein